MNIDILFQDRYLWVFIGSLILYLAHFFWFLEKVENKIKKKYKDHDANLITKYSKSKNNVKTIIEIFDSLRVNRENTISILSITDVNFWSGIIFMISSLLGFILKLTELNQSIALMFMGLAFFFFSITFVMLIIWYRKS